MSIASHWNFSSQRKKDCAWTATYHLFPAMEARSPTGSHFIGGEFVGNYLKKHVESGYTVVLVRSLSCPTMQTRFSKAVHGCWTLENDQLVVERREQNILASKLCPLTGDIGKEFVHFDMRVRLCLPRMCTQSCVPFTKQLWKWTLLAHTNDVLNAINVSFPFILHFFLLFLYGGIY